MGGMGTANRGRAIIRKLTAAVVLTIAVLGPTSPVEARWNRALPRDAYEWLGRCETGWSDGRFHPRGNTAHRTRSYVAAFGFYKKTWDAYADTPWQRAHTLSWEQQARVLDRVFFYGHTERTGPRAGKKLYAAGPWGHGCFRKSTTIQHLVCKHRKWSVRRWCR